MHTPEPWKCTNTSHHYYDYRLEGEHGQLPFEKLAAYDNARLIAAAPELLESLKELCDIVEDAQNRVGNKVFDSFTLQPARAAIAKAEGR